MKDNIHNLIAMLESRKIPYRIKCGNLYATLNLFTSIPIHNTDDVRWAHEQIKGAMGA